MNTRADRSRTGVLVAVLLAAPACGPDDPPGFRAPGPASDAATGADVSTPRVDAAPEDATALLDGTASSSDCVDGAQFVYAVSETRFLYRFDPHALRLTELGRFTCAGEDTAGLNSMAIDRSANAWVSFADGHLFRVDTHTLECVPTGFTPEASGFTGNYGSGFALDDTDPTRDRLYIAPRNSGHLMSVDLGTFDATDIGTLVPLDATGDGSCGDTEDDGPMDAADEDADATPSPLPMPRPTPDASTDPTGTPPACHSYGGGGGEMELTGTHDGRLYGYSAGDSPSIVALDRATGHFTASTTVPDNHSGPAYAFAFWGGSFWIFSTGRSYLSSDVSRFDPATGHTTVVMPDTGYKIVGAGVSTCAPLVAPP